METKANHVMIGLFALGVTTLAFIFMLVLAKVQFTAQYAYYYIKFNDSVSGLPVGGEVRYNGVKVGNVEEIRFVPNEPKAVNVLVKIEKRDDFSLREDTQASLQFLGITGLTYVQLTGVGSNSKKLPIVSRKHDEDVPVIVAQTSTIAQLVDAIPQLIGKAQMTFDRLNNILDQKNQDRINTIIANLTDGSQELSSALKNFNRLSSDAGRFLNEDAHASAQSLTRASNSIAEAADLSNEILAENREALNAFSGQGLAQLATFVTEARKLTETLDRIAQQIESDPAAFVLGGAHGKEIEVGK